MCGRFLFTSFGSIQAETLLKAIIRNMNKTKCQTACSAFGVLLLLCSAAAAEAADSLITFRVDLTVASTNGWFTPGSSQVYARGTFNNWGTGEFYDGSGSSTLTN